MVVAGVSVLMMLVVGCGKKVKCDYCGETAKGQTKTVFGEEMSICDDCLKGM